MEYRQGKEKERNQQFFLTFRVSPNYKVRKDRKVRKNRNVFFILFTIFSQWLRAFRSLIRGKRAVDLDSLQTD